jgi:hypothetical protein
MEMCRSMSLLKELGHSDLAQYSNYPNTPSLRAAGFEDEDDDEDENEAPWDRKRLKPPISDRCGRGFLPSD